MRGKGSAAQGVAHDQGEGQRHGHRAQGDHGERAPVGDGRLGEDLGGHEPLEAGGGTLHEREQEGTQAGGPHETAVGRAELQRRPIAVHDGQPVGLGRVVIGRPGQVEVHQVLADRVRKRDTRAECGEGDQGQAHGHERQLLERPPLGVEPDRRGGEVRQVDEQDPEGEGRERRNVGRELPASRSPPVTSRLSPPPIRSRLKAGWTKARVGPNTALHRALIGTPLRRGPARGWPGTRASDRGGWPRTCARPPRSGAPTARRRCPAVVKVGARGVQGQGTAKSVNRLGVAVLIEARFADAGQRPGIARVDPERLLEGGHRFVVPLLPNESPGQAAQDRGIARPDGAGVLVLLDSRRSGRRPGPGRRPASSPTRSRWGASRVIIRNSRAAALASHPGSGRHWPARWTRRRCGGAAVLGEHIAHAHGERKRIRRDAQREYQPTKPVLHHSCAVEDRRLRPHRTGHSSIRPGRLRPQYQLGSHRHG